MRLPTLLLAAALLPGLARADASEDIFKAALAYTVQVKAAVPVPFEHDKKGAHRGAGFLVDAERGWIMTNAHVAARSPARLEVAFHGQDFVEAEKVYVDPFLDLAVVSVGAPVRGLKLRAPRLDCGELPAVGHPVGAFGHPWNLRFTGTRGIISGVTSKFDTELLQTDAPINQGNSGGPLISLRDGRIVGINTASIVEKGAQNTNFAVAMKYACRVLELLKQGADPSPPDLPVVFYKDLDDRKVLRVAKSYLEPDQLALRPGDLILAANGTGGVQNETQLVHALRGRLDEVRVTVQRDGAEQELRGRLAPAPSVARQRGVLFSGVLFARLQARDMKDLPVSSIMVHHVERGSLGDFSDVEKNDVLDALDGRPVKDLAELMQRAAAAQQEGRAVTLTFKRITSGDALFTYIERSFKVSDPKWVGPEAAAATR